ncbi:MAG: hypothetical protein JO085_05135 [Acidimicrobiia bacterium]|nr:hypothetical protein [Acidimicrobiia bacterium]
MSSGSDAADPLLHALLEAVAVLERVRDGADDLIDAAHALVTQRREGQSWEEILRDERTPRLSGLLADSAEAIGAVSSRVRRTQAEVLYRRGVPMHRIGSLLGITRQRVAALLKSIQQVEGQVGGTPR